MNMVKHKKRLFVILFTVTFMLVLLIVGRIIAHNNSNDKKPTSKGSSGVVGKISDGWDTGIEKETAPPSGKIQIPGYSYAEMKTGDDSLRISIGNPPENKCGFYATLKLVDGTILYKSELLEPGYGMTEVPLNQTLDAGEYRAIVLFECVSLDEKHTPLNSAESEFKLTVK